MLLKKYHKENFYTEVKMPNHEELPLPVLKKPLNEIKVAVVTDGGLVPAGNPDNMVVTNSKCYKRYTFGNVDRLDAKDYEVRHQGYNNAFVLQDPNRLVPVDALEELKKDYVVGARARGVRERKILVGSVLKASMLTIVTLLSLSIGSLLGGTAIVESIFMWDGVGKMEVDAILTRDYPVIQVYVVWMAIIYVMVNLVTDIIYHYLDPRIRLQENP